MTCEINILHLDDETSLLDQSKIFLEREQEKLSDLGFTEEDLDDLVDNTMKSPMSSTPFHVAPVKVDRDLVRKIFEDSLEPMG